MSSAALHDSLILVSALALQLVFTIVLGGLFTSGFYLHRVWVWQRWRIDHINAWAIRYQRSFDSLYMRLDSIEHWIDYLQTTRALHIRMFPIYMHRWLPANMQERADFHRRPEFCRGPLDIANLDGQDERERQPDSDDEQSLGSRVIRNVAAQRSRNIADIVDPRSYGISPRPSTSLKDGEDTSQYLPTTQSDQYGDNLSGSTLCDEAEQPQAYLQRGYYQGRGPRHSGHWDHNVDDDPHPHLPHPHWSEGNQIGVTATTTTQSVHISTLTGQVPSSSVALNPGTDLPSLAAVQNVEPPSRATNSLASHDDDGVPPENRINIPVSRFRQARIHQMSRDLENVHIQRSACGAERQAAPHDQGSSAPAQPSFWNPPPPGTRSDGNDEISSTRVGLWQRKQVTEEEAARLHSTPRQWPEAADHASVNDVAVDPDEVNESILEHERTYAQHRADDFARQHPHLMRRSQAQEPNVRGGGGGSVRPDWDKGKILVEEEQLLARIQHRQSEQQRRTQELQHMQEELDRLRKHRMRKQPDGQVKEVWEHHSIDTHSPRYQGSLAADAVRKHYHEQREIEYSSQHVRPPSKREAEVQHYSYSSDCSNRHYNYAPLEADGLQQSEARNARSIQSPQHGEGLYTELGYQHHLKLDDDNIEGSFQYGVYYSCPSTYDRQQQEDVYAEHHHQLAEFEQQHRFRASVQPFVQLYNLHQIYHIPPPQEDAQTERAPTNLSSHHRYLDGEFDHCALKAIREAQSLIECETARTYLDVLQIALDQRRAELEADARTAQSARTPIVYVNTGDRLVLTPRTLASHVVAERGLMHNATSSTRVDVNFEPVDRDKYRWYAQYPNDYNGEEQTLGSYYGERDADERGIMGDLTSFKTGSVPPFLRGGTSDFKTQEEVFLSSDYDPVAVSRAIAKLNKESAIAQERTVGGPADQDRVAELQHKIDWLTKQRNFAEGSDDNTSTVSGEHFRAGAGLRGGAGEDEGDDDESRARHPECSTRTQDTATSDLPALEKEIMRLNVLMARAQKLPEGNPRNGDILAQLQRMIDQLEAERDAVQTQKAVKKTDHTLSKVDIGGAGPMLSGDAKEAQDAMSSHGPAPPLPLKSPARRGVKKQSPGCVPKSFEKSLDERTEFTELVEQLCKLDRSMACVEALVLAQTENPVLNIELASYGTLAMIRKLRGLLDLRVEVCNRAKLLASSAALSTTSNSTKAPKDFQYTSEVRLRGGGSAQSTVESEEVFSNPAAPPVPARNPARLDAGATPASPTDVDSETAILTQDLIRAGQQFIARLSQVTPSSYLARLEADTIERLVGRIQELQKLQAQPVTSDGSTSACRDLGTGVDAGQQAEISAIQRALSPILQAAGAWAPPDSSSNDAALESRPHSTQRSTPATTTPAPYRILNCPDWTWPHPNWMFNNLSPEQKISLLHERWGWLDRQRNIEEEKHAIDNEVLRLLSLIGLDHDPETHHDPITPGYDRLGNRILGPLGREEDRARLRKGT